MTRRTNARVAGFTFLFYIAVGITAMTMVPGGEELVEKLSSFALHETAVRVSFLLDLITNVAALVLAVTLYALTRDVDRDLAMLACACRVGEGLIGASMPVSLALLWLATSSGVHELDAPGAQALGAFLLKVGTWQYGVSATFFAVGSTLFSWLFLRGRLIPAGLAWLGLVASLLLVVGVPLQLAGLLSGMITQLMWIPMAAFEIPLGLWLIMKGVK
jgi:Domain of unknown function (DUF4386)